MREWVYFAANVEHGPVKIGRSRTPEERVKHLATGSPVPIDLLLALPSDNAARFERNLHSALAPHRLHGEWYEAESLVPILDRAMYLADRGLYANPGPCEIHLVWLAEGWDLMAPDETD